MYGECCTIIMFPPNGPQTTHDINIRAPGLCWVLIASFYALASPTTYFTVVVLANERAPRQILREERALRSRSWWFDLAVSCNVLCSKITNNQRPPPLTPT